MENLTFLESEKKMPLMSLPVRSTHVQLGSGSVLISPGSNLNQNQYKNILNVTDIVAPNLFHCAGIANASSVFLSAKTWAPPKGKTLKTEIKWSDELSPLIWPYQEELPMIALKGMPKVNEVVFIHKKSKSLIVADLCFNLVEAKGLGAWVILGLFGTYKKFATSKFLASFVEDKEAFKSSVNTLYNFDFENIVVSHGQNVIGNAKSKLLIALSERDLAPK